jgi:hypothetical protein
MGVSKAIVTTATIMGVKSKEKEKANNDSEGATGWGRSSRLGGISENRKY